LRSVLTDGAQRSALEEADRNRKLMRLTQQGPNRRRLLSPEEQQQQSDRGQCGSKPTVTTTTGAGLFLFCIEGDSTETKCWCEIAKFKQLSVCFMQEKKERERRRGSGRTVFVAFQLCQSRLKKNATNALFFCLVLKIKIIIKKITSRVEWSRVKEGSHLRNVMKARPPAYKSVPERTQCPF